MRHSKLHCVGKDGPVADPLLPAEIGLRLLRGRSERSSIDPECGLAGAMLVTCIVANGFDEPDIE